MDDALLSVALALEGIFSPAVEAFQALAASGALALDADARARLLANGRHQVRVLRDAFARARGAIDALPRGGTGGVRADARARAELRRLAALVDALPPLPAPAPPYTPPPAALLEEEGAATVALAPASDAPLRAVLALEAYRAALVRAFDLLDAAVAGRLAVPPPAVPGELERVLEAAMHGEEGLKDAYAAAVVGAGRGGGGVTGVSAPLSAALAAARLEANARAAAASGAVEGAVDAVAHARGALAGLEHAGERPTSLRDVLDLGAAISSGWRVGQPLHFALAHIKLGGDAARGGQSMKVDEGAGHQHAPPPPEVSAPEAALPAHAPPPPPPPQQSAAQRAGALLSALSPAERAALLAQLPPGWRPGHALPGGVDILSFVRAAADKAAR